MTPINRFKKIEPNIPLSKKVEEQLREAIIQKVYKAGERLPGEAELSDILGVSRTAIREALRTLAGEGLLKINGRNGAYVSEFDISNVVNPFTLLLRRKCGKASHFTLVQIRGLIEPEIARLASQKRTENDIIYLKKCFSDMQKEKKNPDRMIQKDIEFHRCLSQATNNPIVPIMMEPIFHLLPEFMSDNYKIFRKTLGEADKFYETPLKEHAKILQSIEIQNAETAFKTMKKHMITAEQHVLEYYKSIGFNDY